MLKDPEMGRLFWMTQVDPMESHMFLCEEDRERFGYRRDLSE